MRGRSRKIGFIGFDGVTALDLTGALEAFSIAAGDETGSAPRYKCVILGLTRKSFTSESGVVFRPTLQLQDAPALDTLVIPGGRGLRETKTNESITSWVAAHAGKFRRIVSVCTGIYGLAPTGLLDGRRVTTHWRFASDVAQRFPKLDVDANAIFIKDGSFYTSAGVTAGIDLALALIEEDFGSRLAMSVARELVVHVKRAGGQEQYSEPLRVQAETSDRLGELAAWISSHLSHDLSVEALAERACLSPRQFSRRFKKAFGVTPGEFVERIRLDEARRRLSTGRSSIGQVALSVGFQSVDVFRRAFWRRIGIAPNVYRLRFGKTVGARSEKRFQMVKSSVVRVDGEPQ
jgi:transcriptional regulator GlxA family with amidase domain